MKYSTKLLFSIGLIVASLIGFGQTISPYILGNNYWYPGANTADLLAVGGRMEQAGFQFIRIGGFGANNYSNAQIIEYIDRIRAMGGEPQVQVPYNRSTQGVIDMITYINVTMGRNVTYWSVGNEPDHGGGGHQPLTTIEAYTKRISSALKSVDSTIKVIAFELAGYNQNYINNYGVDEVGYDTHFWDRLLGGSADCTGKDVNGNYYIDIVSWHYYGWNDQTESVIWRMDEMTNRLETINQNRAEAPIQWMMGEINTHWDNTKATTDGKVWSFRAGQAYAEVYGAAMARNALTIAFWSIYEGKDDDNGDLDKGFNDLSLFDVDNTPRSNYWHTFMLGNNMRTNYATSTDNYTSIKTVAMKDENGASVMVMNANTSADFPYSLKLDQGVFTTPEALQISVDAGINFQYEDVIPARTTQMLIFNKNGQLTKKYSYSEQDALARRDPTVVSTPVIITHAVPGKIEAEDYSSQFGLETEDVASTEGTDQNLGFTSAGDYAEYLIDVSKTGDYIIDFRVASLNGGASLSLSVEGDLEIPKLNIATTTGWQKWETLRDTISLTAGEHTLRFDVITGGFNINWMDIQAVPELPTISFSNMTDGEAFDQGYDLNINVTANHTSGIAYVQLYLDNEFLRQENLAPYDWGLGTNDLELNTLEPGQHLLKAVAFSISGDTASVTVNIIINLVTSLISSPEKKAFSAYPNPVREVLHLSENTTWVIYDSFGKTLSKGKGDFIYLTDLNPGIYLLKTPEGEVAFIKQ